MITTILQPLKYNAVDSETIILFTCDLSDEDEYVYSSDVEKEFSKVLFQLTNIMQVSVSNVLVNSRTHNNISSIYHIDKMAKHKSFRDVESTLSKETSSSNDINISDMPFVNVKIHENTPSSNNSASQLNSNTEATNT